MQIVIDIDDELYEKVRNAHKGIFIDIYKMMVKAILHGTPLPKGHGRLIDVDDLDITTITTDDYSGNEVLDVILKEDLDDAPTIIEADRESEE